MSIPASVLMVVAGVIVGSLFWAVVQRLTPVISNEFLDVFVVPIVASVVVSLIVGYALPRFRVFAWCLPIGTLLFATIFYTLVLHH
ncbi:hypothetical protein ACIA8C_12850 [Nocardia sp. NPDC051321]|uniref:hypothetical protein n=1 Tax=Nocardia sp. NPDC051321 TaxID=3364323 RepID=UPI0037AF6981